MIHGSETLDSSPFQGFSFSKNENIFKQLDLHSMFYFQK